MTKLADLQLALVIVRLHESDPDRQLQITKQILCQVVFSCNSEADLNELPLSADSDPFIRSMALWWIKEYRLALSTLLEVPETFRPIPGADEFQRFDVFNFYTYLRTHPLVVRQRLTEAGVNIGSTEKFLEVAKAMENQITPQERRLYFRTACMYYNSGCALLALEVLCKLPKYYSFINDQSFRSREASNDLDKPVQINGTISRGSSKKAKHVHFNAAPVDVVQTSEAMDWGSTLIGGGESKVRDEPKLELSWSDEEAFEGNSDVSNGKADASQKKSTPKPANEAKKASTPHQDSISVDVKNGDVAGQKIDVMAQQLKFIACLKILMEELATLASGYQVEGGQLRYQLYYWLEREVETLKELCDYNTVIDDFGLTWNDGVQLSPHHHSSTQLHEVLRTDRIHIEAKQLHMMKRKRWLEKNQSLLRTFASYCSLHGSQGVGLASARMELLLLLQELHQEPVPHRQLEAPVSVTASFPLLAASIASYKTDIADPIRYLQAQTTDLLSAFAEINDVPNLEDMSKMYLLYNLAQCVSSCIYESLSEIDSYSSGRPCMSRQASFLVRSRSKSAMSLNTGEETEITTLPNKWPGKCTVLFFQI